MIVFPEYGLTGGVVEYNPVQRSSIYPYMENVPEPSSPDACMECNQCKFPEGSETVNYISCLAREKKIYIVVNLIEQQPCVENCRFKDGLNIYNTNVIIDNGGCIVAKYHKYYLYSNEAKLFDKPESFEYSYVDTPFGRLGTLICYDLVFEEPGLSLVEKYNVDVIAMPTYWVLTNDSSSLFENVVEYTSGWSRRMNVNFLVANVHNIDKCSYGSAISTPHGIASYYYNLSSCAGKLMIATITAKDIRSSVTSGSAHFPGVLVQQSENLVTSADGREYAVKRLQGLNGTIDICHGRLCCRLEYNRKSDEELMVLAAHSSDDEKTLSLEVCLLQTCKGRTDNSCFEYPISHSSTVFNYFVLSGYFKSLYAFPMVVASEYTMTGFTWDFDYDNHFHVINAAGIEIPLLNSAIYSFYN